jgi:hypothetical protein
VAERYAAGRARRKEVPRASHAAFEPAADRQDPVSILEQRDMKGSFDVEGAVPGGLVLYAQACGAGLARAHARSGDAAAIAGYLGSRDTFGRAIVEFAEAYADQTERDHAALTKAIKSGQVEAQEGI